MTTLDTILIALLVPLGLFACGLALRLAYLHGELMGRLQEMDRQRDETGTFKSKHE